MAGPAVGERPLRVALIAPIADPVSVEATSSIEHLIALLAEELTARGHAVTVFATGDSRSSGSLHATYPRGYHHDQRLWDRWEFHETMHAAAAFERAADFDVIHTHAYHYALPFTGLVATPVVHTYHVNPDADILAAYRRHPGLWVVAVSEYHRAKFAGLPRTVVIHNGVAIDRFPFSAADGDYLLFLGHLIEKKGPLGAVEVAQAAGMPLVLAGRGSEYYRREVAHLVGGHSVTHVGPVDVEERNRLLAGAACLVFPSVFAEPFGLVLLEAMACGTPVVALERCAVAEIVDPGVTGYFAPDIGDLAALVPEALALDRATVRAQVAKRFDHRRMVDDHEALYRRAVAERR